MGAKLTGGGVMTANCMCQLGWATVPKYLVKHYSECFCKGVFGWDLHSNQWTWSKADYPP